MTLLCQSGPPLCHFELVEKSLTPGAYTLLRKGIPTGLLRSLGCARDDSLLG